MPQAVSLLSLPHPVSNRKDESCIERRVMIPLELGDIIALDAEMSDI